MEVASDHLGSRVSPEHFVASSRLMTSHELSTQGRTAAWNNEHAFKV